MRGTYFTSGGLWSTGSFAGLGYSDCCGVCSGFVSSFSPVGSPREEPCKKNKRRDEVVTQDDGFCTTADEFDKILEGL